MNNIYVYDTNGRNLTVFNSDENRQYYIVRFSNYDVIRDSFGYHLYQSNNGYRIGYAQIYNYQGICIGSLNITCDSYQNTCSPQPAPTNQFYNGWQAPFQQPPMQTYNSKQEEKKTMDITVYNVETTKEVLTEVRDQLITKLVSNEKENKDARQFWTTAQITAETKRVDSIKNLIGSVDAIIQSS